MRQRILCGLALLLCMGSGYGAVITYSASGTLSNSGGLGPPPFPNGTPISFQFSIDADTPNSSGCSDCWAQYSGLTGTFTLGDQTYSIDSYGYRDVRVINNFSYYFGPGDAIYFFIGTADYSSLATPVYNGVRIHNLKLLLQAPDTSFFGNDALSNSAGLSRAAFSSAEFNMQLGDLVYINSDAIGPATSFSSAYVVPVPAALWLLGSALGVLGLVRKLRLPSN